MWGNNLQDDGELGIWGDLIKYFLLMGLITT